MYQNAYPVRSRSPRVWSYEDEQNVPGSVVPVAQLRSHRLDPIALQPRTARASLPSALPSGAQAGLQGAQPVPACQYPLATGLQSTLPLAPSTATPTATPRPASRCRSVNKPAKPRARKRQDTGFRGNPYLAPSVLAGFGHAALAVREMNWERLFQVLDVLIRYFLPCEAFTLYIVEHKGKYLRKINSYLEAFPPERRGRACDAVSETTLEGSAAINAEPCSLPSQSSYAEDWATRETCATYPLPGHSTIDDVRAGYLMSWPAQNWDGCNDFDYEGAPAVSKIHNSLAWPMRFKEPEDDIDPFADHDSHVSNNLCSDETVFGVLKLTNRLARQPRSQKLMIQRLQRQQFGKGSPEEARYMPFSNHDFDFFAMLTCFIKELYFAVDPVTFGSRIERSLELQNFSEEDPLNAQKELANNRSQASRSDRSAYSGFAIQPSLPRGCRMLGSTGGMFGILGNAFGKAALYRRRSAELADIVVKPDLAVTSDSMESMRNAPGWIHKEWTPDDLDAINAEQSAAGLRRIGGITLLATWRLREDAVVDAYTTICRFQLRVRRTSRMQPGQQALWRELPAFFCIQPDEVTQQYCAFLTDYLQYGEEYVACVRAGSADGWSEWSAPSDVARFEARPLKPKERWWEVECELIPSEAPRDPFDHRDQVLRCRWPAFTSFDPRTPLPVEYRVEAWQRDAPLGAAAAEQLQAYARQGRAFRQTALPSQAPREQRSRARIAGAPPDWYAVHPLEVATVSSDAMEGKPVETSVDIRSTSLAPGSAVYLAVRARYLSLPGPSDWCNDALFSRAPLLIPVTVPDLPVPQALSTPDFETPEHRTGTALAALADLGVLVIQWPFIHPATFCPGVNADESGWSRGPFIPNVPPEDFPLPYRVQCRTAGSGGKKKSPPKWSEWREVEAYHFVRRSVPEKQLSQHRAGERASRGGEGEAAAEDGEPYAEGCLDPQKDPLGVLNEDWALHLSGLDDAAEDNTWPGLVQLRWVSCSIEGSASAASRVLCTRVSAPPGAATVEHIVVNCSSGSVQGQGVLECEAPDSEEEHVVHELRQVARLSWELDSRSPSYPFVREFEVRYREGPPGQDVQGAEWIRLPPVPLIDAQESSTGDPHLARFTYDVTGVPLYRHHLYAFSVRVQSPEHVSHWSEPSEPLMLALPDVVVPPDAVDELLPHAPGEQTPPETLRRDSGAGPAQRIERELVEQPDADGDGARHGAGEAVGAEDAAEEGQEQVEEEPRHGRALEEEEEDTPDGDSPGERPVGPAALLEAEVCCSDHTDAPSWSIVLRWHPFQLADGGADRFPPLASLPTEYRISYMCLSTRPCAVDGVDDADASLQHREGASRYQGWACRDSDPGVLQQHRAATVCSEGWVGPAEKAIMRTVPRHRLPPLRCDVRLFVACRCPVVTGPRWSRMLLAVDIALPRQVPLPLPVPRQLGCIELQARGLPMDFVMPDATSQKEGLHLGDVREHWVVLGIPAFPVEFVVTGEVPAAGRDLLSLPGGSPPHEGGQAPAHYVLQYRLHEPAAPKDGANARPHEEEYDWRTVPALRQVEGSGADVVYLASGIEADSPDAGTPALGGRSRWVTFRLASANVSHFGYASPAACITALPQPSRPTLSVLWIDSPSLDGVRVLVSARCGDLSQSYQLRHRRHGADPRGGEGAWTVCELRTIRPTPTAGRGDGGTVWIEARAAIHQLAYHEQYCFGLRTASDVRFSPWSEDSEPVRISLEHLGMCPKPLPADVTSEEGLMVRLLSQEERHNYRCPAADVSWPPLTFPEGVWGPDSVSPSPDVTIEYRVRWRRHIDAHNDRAALHGAMQELRAQCRAADTVDGYVSMLAPDPDEGVKDYACRGYRGDCTKELDLQQEFTQWHTAAVVPARTAGMAGAAKCACALTFLQEGCEYDVAIDWRWRRLGDAFWMQGYGPIRFSTLRPTPSPPPPSLVPIPPEVWDGCAELRELGADHFVLVQWPFSQPPTSKIIAAPPGRLLTEAAQRDPLGHGDYAVQVRLQTPADGEEALAPSPWLTCMVRLLLIHGKPLCLVSRIPAWEEGEAAPFDDGCTPLPVGTPALEPQAVGKDELEFRIARAGDCEVSPGSLCVVAPPPPPTEVRCGLKMLPPHSTLVLCVRFQGSPALGRGSAPREYQLRVEEVGGDVRLLPPVRLPLERLPEAFPGLRPSSAFLGDAQAPYDRNELGEEFSAARGGGEPLQQLAPLEFEHLLSFRELSYSRQYRVTVRWLSPWRVSAWAPPAEADISLFAPRAGTPVALDLTPLDPVELPRDLAGEDFLAPIVADRVEISWAPFYAHLWGGGKMEYQIQRRYMLQDRRPASVGAADDGGHEEDGMDATAWEVAGVVLTDVDDATGQGFDGPAEACPPGAMRIRFAAEDLKLSACYQFRLRVRLLFHPSSGFEGEWSEFIESEWYRTTAAVPQHGTEEDGGAGGLGGVDAPLEVAVPDPPPPELLEDGTALLSFGHLPIREVERPEGAPPPPAPYTLHFRGAEEATTAPWHILEGVQRSGDSFIVSDPRLREHTSGGVVFRLWRCQPQGSGEGRLLHAVEDDARVCQFSVLASKPSRAITVQCPRFAEPPTAVVAFGPCPPAGAPAAPLLLDLGWTVSVPANRRLAPVQLHQVRYRAVPRTLPAAEAGAVDEQSVESEAPQRGDWCLLAPFEHAASLESPQVRHELPLAGPRFPLGADYEVAVRTGTRLRWGDWSLPQQFSLAIHPPTPPEPSQLSAETVKLGDDTHFFRLSWPAFRPHPLSTLVEYRVRMRRMTRYKYAVRLSQEMADRSAESIAAQDKFHVVGTLRRPVLHGVGPVDFGADLCDGETLVFDHDVAADPECGYSFVVDAKGLQCSDVEELTDYEEWSSGLHSEELLTPPLAKNWFIPSQVPLEPAPASHDRERMKAPFPLNIGELTCERRHLSDPSASLLLVFAPWQTSPEALRWPHRIEYSPYIPKQNPDRLPIPGEEDYHDIEWHLPANVEYFPEDSEIEDKPRGSLVFFALVEGFDDEQWPLEEARLGVHKEQTEAYGKFARLRVVREGGPEGLQAFSSPSAPMRLHMPPLDDAPLVAIWCAWGRPHALLWWPCSTATAGEEDKNLDMSTHVHQIRMRRPFYELSAGWTEGPVKKTPKPVLLPVGLDGPEAHHAFELCNLLDDSTMPQDLLTGPLPTQPYGMMPDPSLLTFEFSIRVSDGFRWSAWSKPSEVCNFALEPKIVDNTPVDVRELARLLEPESNTVCEAESIDPHLEPLCQQVTYTLDGDMEPPRWISVAHAIEPPIDPTDTPLSMDAKLNSAINQFVVSWPNLPPHAYCNPDSRQLAVLEEMLDTGLLPPYVPPPLVYRINVWLVGRAPDAVPDADVAEEGSTIEDCSIENGAVLYRQYDLPPCSFPEPDASETILNPKPTKLSWIVPCLQPDHVFRCTIEARFQTINAMEWWTPLMRSGDWVAARVPPPRLPEQLAICDLPTPEYQKLALRTAIGSPALVPVHWPWSVTGGKASEILRLAAYALEFCPEAPREQQAPKTLAAAGDTAFTRPNGPWKEAKTLQLYFVNMNSGQVLEEPPAHAQYEMGWEAVLVASGFWSESPPEFGDVDIAQGEEQGAEANFVHLRWRCKASPGELAVIPMPLHYSAASGPLRTKVAVPPVAPVWFLDCLPRQKRTSTWMKWIAWKGADNHQLSFRILQKPRRRKGRHRLSSVAASNASETSGASESDGTQTQVLSPTDDASGITLPEVLQDQHGGYEPATGWIEMPPIAEGIQQEEVVDESGLGEGVYQADPTAVGLDIPEERQLSEYARRLSAREWNWLLFRHYRSNADEYNTKQTKNLDSDVWSRSEKPLSRTTSATDVGNPALTGSLARVRSGMMLPGDRESFASSLGSQRRRSRREGAQFRMAWGMVVEWRVRVSDGIRWSDWSPPSAPGGLVPPMPKFTAPVHLRFSRREPTIAHVSWSICSLPPGYEHLLPTIMYSVHLTSDERTAQKVLQAGQGTFSVAKLHAHGLDLSEGSCGIVSVLGGEEEPAPGEQQQQGQQQEQPVQQRGASHDKLNDLFGDTCEARAVGEYSQSEARWINFTSGESQQQGRQPVTGFEVTVSGLKPDCVHRLSVRARCATAGLDEPDWQKVKGSKKHPLRWSAPQHSPPVLTPKMPPPMLVPEPVTIPDGKFARFVQTPCVLLKCALFSKTHQDDFNKEHPVVLDVRPAGGADVEFREVPLANFVFSEVEPYGPCRLVHSLPFLSVELRARNKVMNDISAPCQAAFSVPPLLLEAQRGPDTELVVADDGNMFVQLTWTARCLPRQQPRWVQFSTRQHVMEAPAVDCQASEVPSSMILEDIPANAVLASGEAYADIIREEEGEAAPDTAGSQHPAFLCRRCLQPYEGPENPPSFEELGPIGQSRLQNARGLINDGTLRHDEANVREEGKLGAKLLTQADKRRRQPCQCRCRDVVLRKTFPVDGERICHGGTYRFKVRVKDGLAWSLWTEFSAPLSISVPAPRPTAAPQDPQRPAPPPSIEVQLVKAHSNVLDGAEVTLRLRWPNFEGRLRDVEYRVHMWTLSPEQRQRASNKRSVEAKGKGALPPLIGVQTFMMNAGDSPPVQLNDADTPPEFVGLGDLPQAAPPLAEVRPRVPTSAEGPASTGGPAARHGDDGPQVIACVRPYEAPPRAHALRHTPRTAMLGGANGARQKALTVDANVATLPKGYGYVFSIEGKYCRGACGSAGDWSAPLFSKLVEFECVPRQLGFEIDARFGTLLFKGNAAAGAKPTDEQMQVRAPAVHFAEEHRHLPKAMPMMPEPDAWPNANSTPGKYVVRASGRNVYSEVLDPDGDLSMTHLPEKRPHRDDFREL